jgi:hypothetical protein
LHVQKVPAWFWLQASQTSSLVFVGLAIFAIPLNGAYAGVFCGEGVKSGEATGKTEQEAKSAATTWWSSRAGALGAGYEVWERAKDKALTCHPGPFDTIKCTASARPCLPEGKLPDDPHRRAL